MRVILDKRGLTTEQFIIGVIIAIGLLAVVGTILYTSYRGVKSFGNMLPQEITSFKIACEGYVSSGLITEYCNVFRPAKFTKGESYVNCRYTEIQNVLEDSAKITCGEKLELAWCNSLELKEGRNVSNVLVNGKKCTDYTYTYSPSVA